MNIRNEILTLIERNSRIDLKELAVLSGTDEAAVANEIQAMEKEGIICGYHTIIDWSKTSNEKINALIEVRVTPQHGQGFDKIAEHIYKFPEVSSVYLISGAYDFMVMLEGKTMLEVAGFVSERLSLIEAVVGTATHFIMKKYKDHGTILAKQYDDTRELITP